MTVSANLGETLATQEPHSQRPPSAVLEFLLVGGATPFLYLLSWVMRNTLTLDTAELIIGFTMFHAAYVINDPHFSVTYLLFYKDFRKRALGNVFTPYLRLRYWFAGVVAPLGLFIWALVSLKMKSAVSMGWLIQLMFFLVGWHYVKQGFGIMVVLAARRNIIFAPRERIAVLVHCFAGWAYAWSTKPLAGKEVEEKGVVFTKIIPPEALDKISLVLLIASLVVSLVFISIKYIREKKAYLWVAVLPMFISIWSWSIFSGKDPLIRYMIPALHSIQYLYMVWLMKKNEAFALAEQDPPWMTHSPQRKVALLGLSAVALGWVLFNGAPGILDAALVRREDKLLDLGPTPYFAALYVFVNLHHYFMDNVIWRRENPLTKYLRDT